MTVKEIKEYLSHYSDEAEVIVAVSDNSDEYYEYTKDLYDMWVEGDKDEIWDKDDIERNTESNEVYIKVYH